MTKTADLTQQLELDLRLTGRCRLWRITNMYGVVIEQYRLDPVLVQNLPDGKLAYPGDNGDPVALPMDQVTTTVNPAFGGVVATWKPDGTKHPMDRSKS